MLFGFTIKTNSLLRPLVDDLIWSWKGNYAVYMVKYSYF